MKKTTKSLIVSKAGVAGTLFVRRGMQFNKA
jgi:hypothetical protein